MTWLIVTITFYFILAVVFLIDKYLLTSGIPNPKLYAFFIGISGLLLLLIIPFIDFIVPDLGQIALSFLAGAAYIYALYWFFKGLQSFDTSRIVPATGGLVPLFSFIFVYIFSLGEEKLSLFGTIAFILLLLGSVLIVIERDKLVNGKAFKISLIASLFFALSFVLTKYVYLSQPFLSGLVWTRMGGVLMAVIFFIFSPSIKNEILKQKENVQKKTPIIFVANQLAGAGAGLLQNWAIALAPLAYVAIINALQGIQYVFLLIISIFISLKFPQIIKEKITKSIIIQKVFAVALIGAGLALIAFK